MSADHPPPPELIEFLGACPLFADLDSAQRQEIGRSLTPVSFAAGETVLRQGALGDSLFVIRRGRLAILVTAEADEAIPVRSAGVHETVGEIGLLTGARRSASVVAAEAVDLLRLSRAQFAELNRRAPAAARTFSDKIVQKQYRVLLGLALGTNTLLRHLEGRVAQALLERLEIRLLPGGETLVREGDESDALYIVISGRLRIALGVGSASETALLELGRGETVGETGLITGEKRSATAYAIRDTVVARLSRAAFRQLLAQYPQEMMDQFAAGIITRMQAQIKGARPARQPTATLALVPLTPGVTRGALATRLCEQLALLGPTLHLNDALLAEALQKADAAQTEVDDPAHIGIVSWLAEQEAHYRFVVYEADETFSPWTQRCVRQADHVLLVASATAATSRVPLENDLAPLLSRQNQDSLSLVLVHPPQTQRPQGTRQWLDARTVGHHYHVREGDVPSIARLARLLTGQGIALVLSGGGARGFAHIGAYRALCEAGVPIDVFGGSSAGGLMAGQFAMGWDNAQIMATTRATLKHKFDYTFPVTSLMAGGSLSEIMRDIFAATAIEDMWRPCFFTSTNLTTGRLMVHTQGPAWKYTRATSSIPAIVPPVVDDNQLLVDGGMLNNFPVDIMRARSDVGKIIACEIRSGDSRERTTPLPYETRLSGWHVLWRRLNPLAQPIKVPTIGGIMMQVAALSNRQASRATRELADFSMRLALQGHGMLDFYAFDAIVEKGYQAAQTQVATWAGDAQFEALRAASGA